MKALTLCLVLAITKISFEEARSNGSSNSLTKVEDDCINEAGFKCQFPFVYNGQIFHKCTTAGGYSKPWCYDVRGNKYWDYCSNCREYGMADDMQCRPKIKPSSVDPGGIGFTTAKERCSQDNGCRMISNYCGSELSFNSGFYYCYYGAEISRSTCRSKLYYKVSPTAYDLFPQNHVADDEGKTVSVGYWMDLNLCKHFCSENVNCYSFAHCTMNSKGKGDCWLKDKILDGSEPSRDTTTGNQCTTYYQIGCSAIGVSSCQNGGTCVDGANSIKVCSCSVGYSGTFCENEISCSTSGASSCQNGGTCVYNVNGINVCSCSLGYLGKFCEHEKAPPGILWDEETTDMYCAANTFFHDVSNQIECQNKCDAISACPGISYSHKTGFTQYCCVCTNDVLKNGIHDIGFYRKPGCSASGASSCQNGGTCVNEVKGIKVCSCSLGYSGKFCEHEIAPPGCSASGASSCQNGGTCVDGANGIKVCSCSLGYSGKFCENEKAPPDCYDEMPSTCFFPEHLNDCSKFQEHCDFPWYSSGYCGITQGLVRDSCRKTCWNCRSQLGSNSSKVFGILTSRGHADKRLRTDLGTDFVLELLLNWMSDNFVNVCFYTKTLLKFT